MKISILLPYKENFTVNKSGAVSLFVKDLIKNKKKTNIIKVYGDTEEKKFLNKSYVNLNIKKKFFRSTSNTYIDKFLLYEKKFSSDIIEIHNRPSYVAKIKKSKIGANFISIRFVRSMTSGSKIQYASA